MDVFALVKRDLDVRNREGHERFGGPLTVDGPTNGASDEATVVHAYEELLDLIVYLRKDLTRRGLLPTYEGK